MEKFTKMLVFLLVVSIVASGCQAFSNGIAKKTACCTKMIMQYPGKAEASNEDESFVGSSPTGSSDDIIHNLPFSTIAQ